MILAWHSLSVHKRTRETTTMTTSTSENKSSEIVIDSRTLDQQIWTLMADDQWHRHKDALILLQNAHAQVKAAENRIRAQDRKIYELERLAATDSVTGLLNRRGFENFCAQELERARRHNTPGSVLVLFDLDKFKEINDTYGHQAGDACLKKVAETLRRKIRSVDAAARMGGDEFALLLSHTDPEKSANCLNEIRYVMDNVQLLWEQQLLSVKTSMGIKYFTGDISYETAYHAADKSLYENKRERHLMQQSAMRKSFAKDGSTQIRNLGTINAPQETSVPGIAGFMLNAF